MMRHFLMKSEWKLSPLDSHKLPIHVKEMATNRRTYSKYLVQNNTKTPPENKEYKDMQVKSD